MIKCRSISDLQSSSLDRADTQLSLLWIPPRPLRRWCKKWRPHNSFLYSLFNSVNSSKENFFWMHNFIWKLAFRIYIIILTTRFEKHRHTTKIVTKVTELMMWTFLNIQKQRPCSVAAGASLADDCGYTGSVAAHGTTFDRNCQAPSFNTNTKTTPLPSLV